MVDILHKVAIDGATPAEVYGKLATVEGLAGWWTTDTTGDGSVGGKIHFQFGDRGAMDMEVVELVPGRRVLWRCVDGPPEWIDTKISFDLAEDGGWTSVLFAHRGWAEPVEFMHHCTTKWGVFLVSLKQLLETGTGAPFPDDVHIDSWEE